MINKKTPRIRSKLDRDSNKTALEITTNVYQCSIDLNLEMVGGDNKKYLKQFYNYLITKGDKVRSIDTKIKVVRYFMDSLSDEKREINHLRHHLKEVQVITGKNVKKNTRKDIENFFASKNGIKERTREGYKIHIKNFFQWLYEMEEKEYPKIVSWIKTKNIERGFVEDTELISNEATKKILNNCLYLRDKCMIMILKEGALRVGELCNLKFKNIEWDNYGCKIVVDGKTGKRKIRLIDSISILKQWVSQHPFKDDENKDLFICLGSNYGKPIVSQGFYKMLAKTAERAGIKQKIHPHLFRHTRLTELARDGYNEMELRLFAGWSKKSNMPSVYLHIGQKDLDNKMLERNGLRDEKDKEEEEKDKEMLKQIECPMCNEKNHFSNKFCSKCGTLLSKKEAMEIMRANDSMLLLAEKNEMVMEELKKGLMKELTEKLEKQFKVKSVELKA